MNPSPISVALLSLCFFFLTFSPCSNGQAGFTGDISINCGSTGASAATNGRQWLGDVRPKLSPLLLQLRGLSTASTTINKLTSADPVPHKTARISRSKFSYAFQLNSGQKIIRLHFNPTPYRGFKGLRDFFTVEAGPFTLLGNFSASLTAHALAVNTFAKEFCLNIQQNQQLILTFSPTESSRSQDTYAFVNGIEIISMPHGRSYFDGGEIGLRVVGQNSMVYFDDSTALEIVHRLLDVGALAGFEIVKMSNSYDDSLASPSPLPPPQNLQSHTIRNLLSVLGYKHAIATVAVAVISVLSIILRKLREIWEAWSTEDEHKPSVKAERRCRLFKLAEIQSATRNFNSDLVIGRGGFGDVYKGHIDNKQTYVAVKRLKLDSKQGAREFLTEIETLSELRHINLVSLIGYCSQQSEMILVYEYMAGGTLDRIYKHGSDCSSLTWKQRLNICIGAARGLDYLHTSNGIIHRDVKASNILLDENFVAKISDFGLAKAEDRNKLQSHVSTLVRGTRGYFDPSYFITGKLTRKSDIYSFGVVLLEVLCGRRALDEGLLEEEQFLSNWAVGKINKGEVDEIVASNLREEICPSSLKTFVEVARRCLHEEPKHRPTMSQIVLKLEFALKQQNSNEANEDIISPENTEVKTVTSPSDASDYSEILGMLNSPGFTKLFNKVWKEQQSPGCGSS